MNPEHFLRALGVPMPVGGDSLPLCRVADRAVTIALGWSARAVETARYRSTPLVVVAADESLPGPLDGGGATCPVVAVTDRPWAIGSADLGLLIGRTGPADHDDLDERAAAELTGRFLDLAFDGPTRPPSGGGSLLDAVPFAIGGPYRIEGVLRSLVDDGDWLEMDAGSAGEVLTAVARIGGRSVGIVASQPTVDQGRLSPAGCIRVGRLVNGCLRASRPLVSLVDTAGVGAPSDAAEMAVMTRTAAEVRSAAVTKIAVVLGRAVGLGATVMGAVGARADVVLPWPRASFAMSAPLSGSTDVAGAAAVERSARDGDVMDIIHPDDTRASVIEMLELLRGQRDFGR